MVDPNLLKLANEEDGGNDETTGGDRLDVAGAASNDDADDSDEEESDDDLVGNVDDDGEDDVTVFARVDIHGIPLAQKLQYVRGDYAASKFWELSLSLKTLVEGSDAKLFAELRAHPNKCDFEFIEYLCYLDRKFGGDAFAEAKLRVALRNLQCTDASQLYNEPFVIDNDTRTVLNPLAMERNAMGKALLRWISSAFDNRGTLIRLRLRFLEIVFNHLVQDIDMFLSHELELEHLVLLLQDEMAAFDKQLPMVPPKVGSFKWHRTELEKSFKDLGTLMVDLAAASHQAAEVKAAEAEAEAEGESQDFKARALEQMLFTGLRTLVLDLVATSTGSVAAAAKAAEAEAHGPAEVGLLLGEGTSPKDDDKSVEKAKEEDLGQEDAKVAATVAGAANHDNATGCKRKSSSLGSSPDGGHLRVSIPKTDHAAFAEEEDSGLDAKPVPASAKDPEGETGGKRTGLALGSPAAAAAAVAADAGPPRADAALAEGESAAPF